MRIRLRADVLSSCVSILSTLDTQIRASFGPDAMTIGAVDPAHVALAELRLSKDAFEEYDVNDDELCLDLDKIKEILRLTGSGDVVTMSLEENRLKVNVNNITRRMWLLDSESVPPPPKSPDITLSSRVRMKKSYLTQGLEASEMVSDMVVLISKESGFTIFADSDTDEVEAEFIDDILELHECNGGAKSMFSLDYIMKFKRGLPGDTDEVEIELSDNHPTRFHFFFADGEGEVSYLVAPRIENE